MEYKHRIIDEQFDARMGTLGAVLFIGPKGCGKTTTAKQKAKTIIEFQDEEKRENLLLLANNHPSDLLRQQKQ